MKALLQRAPATFEAGFAAIRQELKIPAAFPDTVAAEAERAYPGSGLDRPDAVQPRSANPAASPDHFRGPGKPSAGQPPTLPVVADRPRRRRRRNRFPIRASHRARGGSDLLHRSAAKSRQRRRTESLPIEGWNAQISLLAGMEAGKTMADAGVGILRTLPPTAEQDLLRLRRQAAALGVPWPEDTSYPDLVRNLTSDSATNAAFLLEAARSFRGAGYLAVNGDLPPLHTHGAIASIYAHVTAPLRRLVDRFANEILVALHAGHEPPAWAVEVLDELPSLMGRARSRESGLEQAMLDFAEAALLEPAVGATFRAMVVDLDDRRDQATVQLARPAIVVRMPAAGRRLAEELTVRLVSADPAKRALEFEAAA